MPFADQSSETFWSQWKHCTLFSSFTNIQSLYKLLSTVIQYLEEVSQAVICSTNMFLLFCIIMSKPPIVSILFSLEGTLRPIFTLSQSQQKLLGLLQGHKLLFVSQFSFWFLIDLCLKWILIFPEVHF